MDAGPSHQLPGEASPEAFWVILGSMALILVVMVVFFRRRGWL